MALLLNRAQRAASSCACAQKSPENDKNSAGLAAPAAPSSLAHAAGCSVIVYLKMRNKLFSFFFSIDSFDFSHMHMSLYIMLYVKKMLNKAR